MPLCKSNLLLSRISLPFIYQRMYFRFGSFLNPPDRTLKAQDGIEPHYQIIYKGSSTNYVRFCLSSVVVSTCASTGISLCRTLLSNEPKIFYTVMPEFYQNVIGFSFVSTLLVLVYYLSAMYVYRLYYSEKDNLYYAILMGRSCFGKRKIRLFPHSLSHSSLSIFRALSNHDNGFLQSKEGTKFFISPSRFSLPLYYNNLISNIWNCRKKSNKYLFFNVFFLSFIYGVLTFFLCGALLLTRGIRSSLRL